jgi:histone demethylase JARID1
LKIARGKVKDDEKYTCPICDWRVKIPRDAARPKLEDLQSWQDEIPGLPFQPDEEEILAKIIENAQDFRSHVSPFCNPVMATADEAETQRFYLRKIEGAEILLSYETNFFRQELHKWSPVAPDPPPILETSKSTRKPRPTKLQKLMAQHGVDDPDALPSGVKIKPHTFKRKSMEPQTSRAQHLQPAPGRSDSGTPTSHTFAASASMAHHSHPGPVLMQDGPTHSHPSHYGGYPGPQDGNFMSPRDNPREAFAPHAYLHSGGMPSPGFGGSASPRQGTNNMFTDRGFGGIDTVALGGVGNSSFGSSQPLGGVLGGSGSQDVAQMFDELTNQDGLGLGMDDSQESLKKGKTEREEQEGLGDAKWGAAEDDLEMFFDGP